MECALCYGISASENLLRDFLKVMLSKLRQGWKEVRGQRQESELKFGCDRTMEEWGVFLLPDSSTEPMLGS